MTISTEMLCVWFAGLGLGLALGIWVGTWMEAMNWRQSAADWVKKESAGHTYDVRMMQ